MRSTLVMALVSVLVVACDQGDAGLRDASDVSGDAADAWDGVPDPGVDGIGDAAPDPGVDGVEDVAGEPPPDGPCSYPGGPYGFGAVGDTVPMMSWPDGIAGSMETLPADLGELHCEPGVHSIFFLVFGQSSAESRTIIRDIGRESAHWVMHGAKWFFFEPDAVSPGHIRAFFTDQGIDFGWTTDDSDNSAGADTVISCPLRTGTPWIVVIRSSDMQIVHDNPVGIDTLKSIADDLSP